MSNISNQIIGVDYTSQTCQAGENRISTISIVPDAIHGYAAAVYHTYQIYQASEDHKIVSNLRITGNLTVSVFTDPS